MFAIADKNLEFVRNNKQKEDTNVLKTKEENNSSSSTPPRTGTAIDD